SDFGFARNDFSVGDVNISDFITFIRGIEHATVANDCGVHVRGAHACSVLVAAFCGDELLSDFTAICDCSHDVQVRDRKMRSQALKMSALLRDAIATVLIPRSLRTGTKQPCARRDHW